jgi:hypothetical protein
MTPTYGLAMIVKNGEATLRACLESAKPHIGYWTISDTGSTDGTKAIVKEVLAGIPGKLFDLPFVNFGHNRSEVFAWAHGRSQWILALDADMTVEIDEGFVPDPDWDAALIEMRDSAVAWRLPLVLKGDLPWKSIGAVHEYSALANGKPYRGVPTDAIRVSFPPTQSSPSKRHWHAGLLEEELARQPFDARSTFYLAQTYRELGDPRARDLYVKRSLMDTSGEAWYAAYRAALLTDWPAQAAELLAAWERWPLRLEPLYYAVKGLNAHGCHRAAYQLLSGGLIDQRGIVAESVRASEVIAKSDTVPIEDQRLPAHSVAGAVGAETRVTDDSRLLGADTSLRGEEHGTLLLDREGVGEMRVSGDHAQHSMPSLQPPEGLFVEPGVWTWGIALERSIAAWHIGQLEEFRVLSEALLADPDLPEAVRDAVTRNLALTPQERAA